MTHSLVYGFALAGEALAAALRARGEQVTVADDAPHQAKQERAEAIGATWAGTPSADELAALLDRVDRFCPAPGLRERSHPAVLAAVARGMPIKTEIDLAYEWEQQRPGGPRPILAVTGTDGKTTTTLMTAHLLQAAGRRPAAVGNTEIPFVQVLDGDADCFVVECSSFRLNWLASFRAEASVWLNVAPDHLDWHHDFDAYLAAKSQMWAHARTTDVAIGNADDAQVRAALERVSCIRRTFGSTPAADYHEADGWLTGPQGRLVEVSAMSRAMPHDRTNALGAAALVLESGLATPDDVAVGLASFRHPAHRIEFVAEAGGVRWYDDSKATSPHAAVPAIRSFDSLVLIAGGKNKDLDLSGLASEPDRVRAVVATGMAANEVAEAFAGVCPVVLVQDHGAMAEAVHRAAGLAKPGDAVLLSPACTSYDWYRNYNERGDDFQRCVREMIGRDR